MKSSLVLGLFCLWTGLVISVQAVDLEALRECGNIHHLDFRSLPNAVGAYSNNACKLKCSIGDKVLSDDVINEGFPCPYNPNGICKSGQCIGGESHGDVDALKECSNLHHINFNDGNHTGSGFFNSKCFLKCVSNGNVISSNAVNEGFPCPADANGICRNGQCVATGHVPTTHAPSTPAPVTHAPTTHAATTHAPLTTLPQFVRRELSEVKELQIKVLSGTFFQTENPMYISICLQKQREQFNEFHRGLCQQIVNTDKYPVKNRHPIWNQDLQLNGTFTRHSYILVNMWDATAAPHRNIGQWSQSVDYIFYSASGAAQDKNVDLARYVHHEKLDMVHDNKLLGDLDVDFSFVLGKH